MSSASAGRSTSPSILSLVASNRLAALLILAFFVADLVFIGLRLATPHPAVEPQPELTLLEISPVDLVMYAKWLTAAVAMWVLRREAWLYRLWFLVFLYVFVDDIALVHERVADRINRFFPFADRMGLPVEGWAILQVAYMGVVGLVVMVAVWWLNRRERNATALRYSVQALILFGVFVAFAGLADFLTDLLFGRSTLSITIEEGGEMLVGTIIAAHAISQVLRYRGAARA